MLKRRLVGAAKGALIGLGGGVVLGVAVGALIDWRYRVEASAGIDPSQKARILAQGMAEAMNMSALLVVLGIPIGAAVGAVRARPR
jgi:hypothetical protein